MWFIMISQNVVDFTIWPSVQCFSLLLFCNHYPILVIFTPKNSNCFGNH